jgi:Tfp pilus assembly protein PilE
VAQKERLRPFFCLYRGLWILIFPVFDAYWKFVPAFFMLGECMKHVTLIVLTALFALNSQAQNQAQERMFRCENNYYTNSLSDPKAKSCKPLEGGNVTVVQGTRPAVAVTAPAVRVAAAPQANQRVDAGEQRSRDSDAKQILEAELKKAEARQAELTREFNNGEPEKRGDEARNYQKYLDRVAELKASLSRNESDIAGIRRELGRSTAANSASGNSVLK